jgi:hypothetical protein
LAGDFPLCWTALKRDTNYWCIVVSAMLLIPESAIIEPESGAVVVSVVVVVVVVVDSSAGFGPHPVTARAMVSDSTATIMRAKIFRIFTIHLLSNVPRPWLAAAA